jgi:hypothetical protein
MRAWNPDEDYEREPDARLIDHLAVIICVMTVVSALVYLLAEAMR